MATINLRKATPTEYKGVTYRSKCEAMFARYLELDGLEAASQSQFSSRMGGIHVTHDGFGFQYEPPTLIEGWNPDFLTWIVCTPRADGIAKGWFHHSIPSIRLEFIEYKPQRPSEAYCKRFSTNTQLWMQAFGESETARRTSFSIHYGNAYKYPEQQCSRIVFEDDYWVDWKDDYDWLANSFEDLLSYRFDLKNGGE